MYYTSLFSPHVINLVALSETLFAVLKTFHYPNLNPGLIKSDLFKDFVAKYISYLIEETQNPGAGWGEAIETIVGEFSSVNNIDCRSFADVWFNLSELVDIEAEINNTLYPKIAGLNSQQQRSFSKDARFMMWSVEVRRGVIMIIPLGDRRLIEKQMDSPTPNGDTVDIHDPTFIAAVGAAKFKGRFNAAYTGMVTAFPERKVQDPLYPVGLSQVKKIREDRLEEIRLRRLKEQQKIKDVEE